MQNEVIATPNEVIAMPNEVVVQLHCLVVAAEEYDGIIFTNINGNLLSEQVNEDTDNICNAPDNQHTSHME